MGTADRTDRPLRRRWVAVLALGLLPLAGCGDDEPEPGSEVDSAVEQAITRTLQQRGRGLRDGDEDRFLRSVRRQDAPFLRQERTYFANLDQLPVETLAYTLDRATLVPDGDSYWGEVLVHLQLEGYDAAPVVTRDRFRFTPNRTGSRYLVSSTTDPVWESDRQVPQQPWDLGAIRVVESSGVLGIFDDVTYAHYDEVMSAVDLGRFDVSAELPDAGLDDVVVYAPGDDTYLKRLRGLPVTDPNRLDAATVPVLANAEKAQSQVASYRIVVNPRVLSDEIGMLDRLMRHELTHVMLGSRGDGAPLWLSEGIAEYVSVQPIPPASRQLPAASLALARKGVAAIPEDDAFRGPDAEGWYGIAWWICEYVARTYGESTLWGLLDELAGDADQDRVIREQLGLSPDQLIDGAMRLLLGRYDPDTQPSPTTPSPTDPSTSPTDPSTDPTDPSAPSVPTSPSSPTERTGSADGGQGGGGRGEGAHGPRH